MPFIKRDNQGNIIAVSDQQGDDFHEEVGNENAQLSEFLYKFSNQHNIVSDTDLSFIRVIDDLINVLIEKNHIRFTDLPSESQEKFRIRRALRDHVSPKLDILPDEEDGFF